MYSCTGNCMQMWLPFLAVVNVLRIVYFFSFTPSLLSFPRHFLDSPLLGSFSVIFHLPFPLPSPSVFCQLYASLFSSSILLPIPKFSGCCVSLPLIGEAFPIQGLVQLYSLLPLVLPFLSSSSSSSAFAPSWMNGNNTLRKATMSEPGCSRSAPPVSIPVTDRCVILGKEVHSSLLSSQTWGRAGVGSSCESEEGKETGVINRMKEDEGKKKLEYFSPFFFLFIQHISIKKICHSWRNHSFICVFISLLYNLTIAFQTTTHHWGELDHSPERIPTAASSSGRLTRQRADKEDSRFLPDLSIRGSLRKWEQPPIVTNRLPPTGREPDPMEVVCHSKLQWKAGQAILRMVTIASNLPIPPQSHKSRQPQPLSYSPQLWNEPCITPLTILGILKLGTSWVAIHIFYRNFLAGPEKKKKV